MKELKVKSNGSFEGESESWSIRMTMVESKQVTRGHGFGGKTLKHIEGAKALVCYVNLRLVVLMGGQNHAKSFVWGYCFLAGMCLVKEMFAITKMILKSTRHGS